MMRRSVLATLLCLAVHGMCAAAPKSAEHQFGVIGHNFGQGGGEAQLEQALSKLHKPQLAFVLATGLKSANEPCSDTLYAHRRDMLASSQPPIIVTPAASDWADCKNSAGRMAGNERLNRLRELLYAEPAEQDAKPVMVVRQSANAKFRSYAENAHWTTGKVLYATVNIPSNNNHYRAEAGRNSEFEDRVVANRFWISRLFALAKRKKLDALVLFSEGNIKVLGEEPGLLAQLGRGSTQDGFVLPRRQIVALAAQFEGKVLLIDTAPLVPGKEPAITWRGNLGHVSVGAHAVQVHVTPKSDTLFTLEQP
ncbi:MAG: hypothetical protein ACJ8GW_16160 [Massilia sp.]